MQKWFCYVKKFNTGTVNYKDIPTFKYPIKMGTKKMNDISKFCMSCTPTGGCLIF